MPIGVYAGLELVGHTVAEAVREPKVQVAAILALRECLSLSIVTTAMDLSLEAEAFGCEIRSPEHEVPEVLGRRVMDTASIAALPEPKVGQGRGAVPFETVRRLVGHVGEAPVLGCMIGPFSLAARLFGVAEALEATAAEPEVLLPLLERVSSFLERHARGFRDAGAAGVVVAEPAAGLLSPRGMGRFSTPFVRRLVSAVQGSDFAVVLHDCAARLVHLEETLAAGAEVVHVGAPMDLVAALERTGEATILAGNLDPTAVFRLGTPDTARHATRELLERTRHAPSLIVSPGCDVPPGTPLENLTAFVEAVREG